MDAASILLQYVAFSGPHPCRNVWIPLKPIGALGIYMCLLKVSVRYINLHSETAEGYLVELY